MKTFYQICLYVVCLWGINTLSYGQNVTQSNFTGVIVPQYMASGTSTRLPILFRATISGLTANTTYRYFVQGATNSNANGASIDFGTTNPGAGNPLLINTTGTTYTYTTSPAVTTAGNHETFTTNASGSYTGWFGFVNTGNGRFTAGNAVFPCMTIANTSGTVLFRRALDVSITVLTFSTSAGANNGSFYQGTTTSATAKNTVALFDNVAGTGRPLFVSPVNAIGATIASTITNYSTTASAWNAIIPNNNANGVKAIVQYSIATGLGIGSNINASSFASSTSPANGTTVATLSNIALDTFISTQNGNWQTATTWVGNTTPDVAANISVAHDITWTANITTNNNITVLAGKVLDGATFTLSGTGAFTLSAGATLRTANIIGLNCIGVSGTKTFTAGANYELNGTTLQTVNNPTGISANNFTINNSAGVKLSNDLTVTGALTLTSGDLDLNSNDIDLGSVGILAEDRVNNHIIIDNTAVNEAAKGGSILFANVAVGIATTEIRGTGLYLQRTTGSDYTVNVARFCYRGAAAQRGGTGAKRIYRITGDATGTNSTMRIYYAADEVAHIGSAAAFVLYRWQSATGWRQANDTGSGFTASTNGADYVEATNINGFSDWTIGSAVTPLPITLVAFKGKRIERGGERTNEVKLEWSTAQEIHNKGFELQMSKNGLTYQNITFVEGKGNSTTTQSYSYITLQPNDAYYRLKQIDTDGTYTYSPTVFVEGMETLHIYPNPNQGTFNVLGITTGQTLSLRNAQGKEVWAGKAETDTITIKDLPAGIYFLHTITAGKAEITKIVIKK